MLRSSKRTIAVAIAFGVLMLAPALARAGGDVSVVLTAQRVTLANGKEALVSAERARPGDVIEYRAVYRNGGSRPVRDLAATLPVPQGMEFLPGAAAPQPMLASLDGKTFEPMPLQRRVRLADGREVTREVPAAEYRFLRWSLGTLGARESRTVMARVRVSPLEIAALAH